MFNMRYTAELCEKTFYTGDREAVPRGIKTDKQCRICILTGGKIMLQVDLGSGIKVYPPFLISLSQYNAFPFGKIDIRTIEIDQLADTDSC